MKNSDDIHTLFKNAVAYKEKEISRDIGMVKSIKELLNYYSEQDVHSIKEMPELLDSIVVKVLGRREVQRVQKGRI